MADSTTTPAGEQGADSPAEIEPDYRFTLANERTFLAWQRTSLGLLAAAVALVQLVPELAMPGARRALGVRLAVLAILTSGMGLLRWQQADRAMRRGAAVATPSHTGLPRGWVSSWSGSSRSGWSSPRWSWVEPLDAGGRATGARDTAGADDAGLDPDVVRVPGQRRAADDQEPARRVRGCARLIPALLAAAAAACTYLIALQRQRTLQQRPTPGANHAHAARCTSSG